MSYVVVSSGVTSSGVGVGYYDRLLVENGGTASATQISGAELVQSGGLTKGDVVSSGGGQTIAAGGSATDVTVLAGGLEWLNSGSHDSAITISSGGRLVLDGLVVSSHASLEIKQPTGASSSIWGATLDAGAHIGLVDVSVSGGGTLKLDAGVLAFGAMVSAGGSLTGAGSLRGAVRDAGVVSGLTLGAATVAVTSGGVLEADALGAGAHVTVAKGARASGLTIGSGAVASISGGVISGSVVHEYGTLGLVSGGKATGTVGSGGFVDIYSGGEADGTILRGDGEQFVAKGGVARGTMISSGGGEVVVSGGTSIGATVFNGGTEVVDAGTTVSGLTLGSGAELDWNDSNATITGLKLVAGADIFVPVTSGKAVISGSTLEIENARGAVLGTATLANTNFSLVSKPVGGGYTEIEVEAVATSTKAAIFSQAMATHGPATATAAVSAPHSATADAVPRLVSPH